MEVSRLAELHDSLVNGKSRRGKLGGLGSGQKKLVFEVTITPKIDVSVLPPDSLYRRFVPATKKTICRHTVIATLKQHGGKMRWRELVSKVANDCNEEMSSDVRNRVLINIPEGCLSSKSPLVEIPK